MDMYSIMDNTIRRLSDLLYIFSCPICCCMGCFYFCKLNAQKKKSHSNNKKKTRIVYS